MLTICIVSSWRQLTTFMIVQCKWDQASDMHFIVFHVLKSFPELLCKSQQQPWQKVLGWAVKSLETGRDCHNGNYPNLSYTRRSRTAKAALVSSFDGQSCQVLRRVKLPFLLETLRHQTKVISLPQVKSVTDYHSGFNKVSGHRRVMRAFECLQILL